MLGSPLTSTQFRAGVFTYSLKPTFYKISALFEGVADRWAVCQIKRHEMAPVACCCEHWTLAAWGRWSQLRPGHFMLNQLICGSGVGQASTLAADRK